jgi:subtilisin-like proprotein convertase family protein
MAATALLLSFTAPLAAGAPFAGAAAGAPFAGAAAGAAAPGAPVTCSTTTAVSYGANSVAGSISSPGSDACFTFTAAPGDVVWLNMAATSGSLGLFFDFFRPGPISTCAGPYGGATSCSVPSGGSGGWTLQVSDSSGTHTGTFRLSLQRLDLGVGCSPVKYGHAIVGKIAKKASFACFTFTASSGDFLFARNTGTSGSLTIASAIETSPSGSLQCDSNGTLECPLASAGSQTLVLYSESGQTKGSFVLYTQRMTGPKDCKAVTAGGAKVGGSVPSAGDVACFDFTGKSGQTATATLSSLTGTLAPLIDFFRPAGTSACASPATSVTCALDSMGTWTVLVDDDSASGTGTGAFSFALTKS